MDNNTFPSAGEKPEFGWTGFNCKHDDTLPQSANCRAQRYKDAMAEKGMEAKCFNFERIAVRCFHHKQFHMATSVSYDKRKIYCKPKASKEGIKVGIRSMGVKVGFKADGADIPQLKNRQIRFSKSKGYYIKFRNARKKLDFKCLSCEVHVGEKMLGKSEPRCRKTAE